MKYTPMGEEILIERIKTIKENTEKTRRGYFIFACILPILLGLVLAIFTVLKAVGIILLFIGFTFLFFFGGMNAYISDFFKIAKNKKYSVKSCYCEEVIKEDDGTPFSYLIVCSDGETYNFLDEVGAAYIEPGAAVDIVFPDAKDSIPFAIRSLGYLDEDISYVDGSVQEEFPFEMNNDAEVVMSDEQSEEPSVDGE